MPNSSQNIFAKQTVDWSIIQFFFSILWIMLLISIKPYYMYQCDWVVKFFFSYPSFFCRMELICFLSLYHDHFSSCSHTHIHWQCLFHFQPQHSDIWCCRHLKWYILEQESSCKVPTDHHPHPWKKLYIKSFINELFMSKFQLQFQPYILSYIPYSKYEYISMIIFYSNSLRL